MKENVSGCFFLNTVYNVQNVNIFLASMTKMNIRHICNFLSNYHNQMN